MELYPPPSPTAQASNVRNVLNKYKNDLLDETWDGIDGIHLYHLFICTTILFAQGQLLLIKYRGDQ